MQPIASAFWQVGADGGFLPAPVNLNELLIAPATTGRVMKFVVTPLMGKDTSKAISKLKLHARPTLTPTNTRQASLNEEDSQTVLVSENSGNLELDCADGEPFGPRAALLGTVTGSGVGASGNPLLWMDEITENPMVGDTETWEIYNFTADAHPIHLHLVQFQVVGREKFDGSTSVTGFNTPLPGETGEKDTVIAYPGEITKLIAKFDMQGLYVWHCHIIDHEDNEMMRPYFVGDPTGYPKISVAP